MKSFTKRLFNYNKKKLIFGSIFGVSSLYFSFKSIKGEETKEEKVLKMINKILEQKKATKEEKRQLLNLEKDLNISIEEYEVFLEKNGINIEELDKLLFWPNTYFDKYSISLFNNNVFQNKDITSIGLIVLDINSSEHEEYIANLDEIKKVSLIIL
jgi:uncharacterized protein YacL (UPF0231 family)